MRCVTYARVSHDNSGRGRSVDEQQADLRRWVEARGWELTAEIEDNSISASRHAKRKDRPGWSQVGDLVRDDKVDVVAVWESSRTTRDLGTFTDMRDLLRDSGVLLLAGGSLIDFDDPSQAMTAGVKAVTDEYEADETRKRVLRAVRANALEGKPHGRLPYGYARTYDKAGNFVDQVLDDEQAAVIRRMFDAVMSGTSLRRLAEELTDEGIPTGTGKEWHPSTIRRLLRNPTITGLRSHHGELVEGTWPAIITDVERAALLSVTDRPHGRATPESRATWLLSGIARCGRCGGPMYRAGDRGTPVYCCKPGKGHVSVRIAAADDLIRGLVSAWLDRPEVAAGLSARQQEDLTPIMEQLQVLRARLDAAAAEYAAGDLTAKMLGKVEGRLTAEIGELEREARRAVVPSHLPSSGAAFVALDIDGQKAVVRALMKITIMPGRLTNTFDPARVEVDWLV
jgi:DNA invertase Pin-like site-specific DNA recombinase